ncbi:hypothetical protein M513_08236, partial [Trichuris suis]
MTIVCTTSNGACRGHALPTSLPAHRRRAERSAPVRQTIPSLETIIAAAAQQQQQQECRTKVEVVVSNCLCHNESRFVKQPDTNRRLPSALLTRSSSSSIGRPLGQKGQKPPHLAHLVNT